ncbi:uncharacterized protein LOC135479485 isoform X2 [Liolophura sinensis]|uniref:uncharacterized protein LOC135479485 isoform X2 n=1 Tax=Liolophura sinensis TaxID=3198878 RepID=UPI00315963D4
MNSWEQGPTMARLVILFCIGLVFSATQVTGDASLDFATLSDQFWSWTLHTFPEFATGFGYSEYNDQLESYNLTVHALRKAKVEEFLDRLRGIKKDELRADEQLNYVILEDAFNTYIEGYTWMKFGGLNPVSFMNGLQNEWRNLMNVPFKTKPDFENFITRIGLLKTRLAEYTELCQEAVRLNRTHHWASLAKVPGQIDAILVEDPFHSAFYEPFKETLENLTTISQTEKEDFRSRALVAINTGVLHPFRDFKTFLKNDYMPYSRPAAGVGSWDQGRDYYEACLKWQLSVDMTPEEVHARGESEVQRVSGEMMKVMRSQDFHGSISEYFESLRSQDRFKFPSGEAIIEEYEDIIYQRINTKLGMIFSKIPDAPLTVAAMPYDGSSGSYSNGVFYANVMRPNLTNSFDLMSLALHEGNPGHHFQISYMLQRSLPVYRKRLPSQGFRVPFGFPAHTAYIEGWALYAEALGEEMRVYKDDYELMGRYSREMLRACRLVVDTGIHVLGWTREEAILYISNYTSYSRPEIENQVDRYITFPGQACAYKIGELKIWELRHKAEKELGNNFDLKDFHTTILDLGNVPLRLMEEAVDHMIERVKGRSSHGNNDQSSTRILVSAVLLFMFVTGT